MFSLFAALLTLCTTYSCVDQEFDVPPGMATQEEDISTITLAELKQMHVVGDEALAIPEGTVVKGVVISDDTEGNFFQDLVIQDETAGIHIRSGLVGLSTLYPPGRLMYIDCSGLYLGDFNGLTQIGVQDAGSNVGRIPEVLIPDHFIIGPKQELVTPTEKTLATLGTADLSSLVIFNNVEFSNGDLGTTFAEPNGGSGRNKTIQDCNGEEIVMRNSDFAGFAGIDIPEGNGSLVAVYTTFGDTKQLIIRDVNDVNFEGTRCDGGGGMTGVGDQVSIEEVKTAFANGALDAPDGFINGIVISDRTTDNLVDQNLFIQDGDFGIVVRFTDAHDFSLGDELQINTSGQELSEFNGLLQLNNVTTNNATRISSGNIVTPKVLTVSELLAGSEELESTLITIENATISGNSTFEFETTVSDGTGSVAMFTRSDATFATDAVPSGDVNITAIASDFNGTQILLRKRSDVTGGGTSTGGGDISVNFETQEEFDPINITGWSNVTTEGSREWVKRSFSGNGFAEATSFSDSEPALDAWLITPELDLSKVSSLNFESAMAFYQHNGLSVMISQDYNGDLNTATWQDLGANLAGSSNGNYEWVPSGNIDLTVYTGNAHIAFRYQGTSASNTTTFRLDNITIE
jgi:hypothetical protein